MQSNYILVPIDDDEDIEEILTFSLKYSECRILELYIEKKIYRALDTIVGF